MDDKRILEVAADDEVVAKLRESLHPYVVVDTEVCIVVGVLIVKVRVLADPCSQHDRLINPKDVVKPRCLISSIVRDQNDIFREALRPHAQPDRLVIERICGVFEGLLYRGLEIPTNDFLVSLSNAIFLARFDVVSGIDRLWENETHFPFLRFDAVINPILIVLPHISRHVDFRSIGEFEGLDENTGLDPDCRGKLLTDNLGFPILLQVGVNCSLVDKLSGRRCVVVHPSPNQNQRAHEDQGQNQRQPFQGSISHR